jgi:anti-anti-sigma factor
VSDILTVRSEVAEGIAVIHIAGEVDMSNTGELWEQMMAGIPDDTKGAILDLTETTYIDSAGLRLVFDLARRLGMRSRAIALVVPEDSQLRRVLELTAIDRVAAVATSLEGALAACSTPQGA